MIGALFIATLLSIGGDPPAQPPVQIEPPSKSSPARPVDRTYTKPQSPNSPPPPPAQPVPPPFVSNPGAAPRRPDNQAGQKPAPYIAGVNQWVVETGTSWKLFADKVQPGDEILLTPLPHFHIPQDFGSLQGTAEKPIVIRSLGPPPAAIACEEYGFKFLRARHIVVENLIFLNAVESGLVLDGAPVAGAAADSPLGKPEPAGWNAEFLVRNCTFAGTRTNPDQDAIRICNANNIRVDSVRVDGWNDNALEIDAGRRIMVRGLMMVPGDKHTQRRGVSVLGASADVVIAASSFNKGMHNGVWIGTPGLPDANGVTATPPVERLRVDRCIFDRIGTPIVIANARDATITRITVVDPTKSVYTVDNDAGIVERVLIEKSLASWMPGKLLRFSPHPERIAPTAITLGDNLWYSAELPAAFAEIGNPFGYAASAQLTDIDPKLDMTSLRPQSFDGVRYGALSIASVPQTTPNFGPAGPGNPVVRPPASGPTPPAATPTTKPPPAQP